MLGDSPWVSTSSLCDVQDVFVSIEGCASDMCARMARDHGNGPSMTLLMTDEVADAAP